MSAQKSPKSRNEKQVDHACIVKAGFFYFSAGDNPCRENPAQGRQRIDMKLSAKNSKIREHNLDLRLAEIKKGLFIRGLFIRRIFSRSG
jgi:hypothetical protein